jgi:signal transduction histidine kinase
MSTVKILIVEDESIIAEDIAVFVEELGYSVAKIVVTGEDAIAAARGIQPDLILMDIMLRTKMDGIEAARQIWTELQIPIIYLTANADEQTLARIKNTSVFGYILKPYKEKELQVAIEIALARHLAEMEAQAALKHALATSEHNYHYFTMASHEFRTPLSVIQNSAELLQNYSSQLSDEKKQQGFQRIQSAVNSMSQILEDILVLGNVECCKFEFERSQVDVIDFCRELIEALQWNHRTAHTFIFNSSDELIHAQLDEKLLWHILNNLLSNAIKYSPEGGQITLTLAKQEQEIWFQIEDEGIGIPSNHLMHLFEPFQRANNVGQIPGTGLGLTITKRAVDLHQGQIEVASELGKGTVFTVKLPIA